MHTVPVNTDPDADVWLSTLSLGFFINAKLNIGLNILLGIPCVIMDRPFGVENFDVIERHRITFLFIPPPVAAAVAGDSDRTKNTNVSSVKWLLSAGASMHEGLQRSVSRKMNNVHLDLEWGTTETLLIAIHQDGHASPHGSSGVLVNGIEARVIDTVTGKDLSFNQPGEILVRNSACRFAGYKNNGPANKSTFDEDGWFHSGDLGYLDHGCNVYITDRMKELIRVGDGYGVHISAVELEATIFEHPAVAQAMVIGVPDPVTNMDRATAFVILPREWQDKQESAEQALEQWTSEKLRGLKALTGGIVVLATFPTIGFKINRRALRALAIAKHSLEHVVLSDERSELQLPSMVQRIVMPTLATIPA
jgi:4-coumarate--CoA ligase